MSFVHKVHRSSDDLGCGTLSFFQQKPAVLKPGTLPPHRNIDVDAQTHKIQTASKTLLFDRTTFTSNKSFASLFGDGVRQVERRTRFFMGNKAWYDTHGVPYQLGMLFSGLPGCGKSSVIRAIANLTQRHIVNVNFANILTTSQFESLFFDDVLDTSCGGKAQRLRIPISKRLYVVEEVDASGESVVCGRGQALVDGQLSLRDILDVLDGNREAPGRMLIMTANRPEVLDAALTRPGRLDLTLRFGEVSQSMLGDMFESFFNKTAGMELPGAGLLTPAEVNETFFQHVPDGDVSDVAGSLASLLRNKGDSSLAICDSQNIPGARYELDGAIG